ncbi:MAG: 50S ribosomal protein L18e [Candidatus Micrarchaeia archaeon]|jgi:large subunit ribosomal protein L18e
MRKEKFSPKNLLISAGIPPEARKSPFWKRVLELLSAPSRSKCGVNISRISANVKEGATVVVADKVLGAGKCSPRLTVAAVAFSATAKKAIEAAGGRAISIVDAAKKSPAGKDAVIIK